MKLAIVTGGSRGLGAALIEKYKKAGFTVKDLSRSGKSEDSIQVDLAQPEEALAIVRPLFEELAVQPIEEAIFFNNAGVTLPMGMTSHNETADVLANIHVNYTSPILLITEFTKAFHGHACPKLIVNITSGAAESPMHGASLYCGAKAGIEQFLRVVALEQKEQAHPIKVLNVVPGLVDTKMQADVRGATEADFPLVHVFRGFVENGSLRSPEAVAEAIQSIIAANPETGSRPNVNDYI